MKHSLSILRDEDFRRITNKENLKDNPFEFTISKNKFEFDDIDELAKKYEEVEDDMFISQLNIINVLTKEDYDKICVRNIFSRTGLTHKVVTEVGNYRFTEACNNIDNVLIRRYFILNFNKTKVIEEEEYCDEIYELDMMSFCILICELCSAKQDIEDNIGVEDAKKHLEHGERIIGKFIKYYSEKKELVEMLNGDNTDK